MLSHLQLFDFRNHHQKSFEFEKKPIVFFGANGNGKTNILEAISVLSVGKSWRETLKSDLIHNKATSAKVSGIFEENTYETILEERSRSFFRNGKKISLKSHLGNIPTILFCPEYLNLFSGSKTHRQKFFDRFLAQLSVNYRDHLARANRAHKQKTKLLKQSMDRVIDPSEIHPWNQILAESVPVIITERQKFITTINPLFQKYFSRISNTNEPVKIELHITETFECSTKEILAWFDKNFGRECAAQRNFMTPSRDDFCFFLRDKKILQSASRGEERSVLLALLSSQKQFLNTKTGKNPILLLDDVFSELDTHRQKNLSQLCHDSQVFFTTTHENHFEDFDQPVQKFFISRPDS